MSSHVSPQPSLVGDGAESKICTIIAQETAVNKDISTSQGGFGTVAIPHYSGARLAHNKRNGNRLIERGRSNGRVMKPARDS